VLQVGQPSSAIGLLFDEFEAIGVSLHRPGAVGKKAEVAKMRKEDI